MKLAVSYHMRNPPQWRVPFNTFYKERIEHMCQLEELGFDRVLIEQHHFEEAAYGPSFSAFAGMLAARTKRVRVGNKVMVLPQFNPVLVAEEMAVLDNLLEGRLDVGVGVGHRLLEFKVLGVPSNQRPSRMEEGLEILRLSWQDGSFSFHGRRYAFDDIIVEPKPLQKPHPPLWIAARTVEAARRAARFRCHLYPGTNLPEVFQAYFDTLKAEGEDRTNYHVSKIQHLTVTKENPEKVWERLAPFEAYDRSFYDTVISEFGDPPLTGQSHDLHPAFHGKSDIIGDPDMVLDALRTMRDTEFSKGIWWDELILKEPHPGVPLSEAAASFELFAKYVMPEVQKW